MTMNDRFNMIDLIGNNATRGESFFVQRLCSEDTNSSSLLVGYLGNSRETMMMKYFLN